MEYAILFLPLLGSIIGYFGRTLTKFFSEIITSLFVSVSAILSAIVFWNGIEMALVRAPDCPACRAAFRKTARKAARQAGQKKEGILMFQFRFSHYIKMHKFWLYA